MSDKPTVCGYKTMSNNMKEYKYNRDDRYMLAEGVHYTNIGDVHFLSVFRPGQDSTPMTKSLNITAAYYITMIYDWRTVGEMLDMACGDLNVKEEDIRPGLEAFLDALRREKFIVPCDGPKDLID